jgi:hypothetical protein
MGFAFYAFCFHLALFHLVFVLAGNCLKLSWRAASARQLGEQPLV